MVEATRTPDGPGPVAASEPKELIARARSGDAEAWGELYRHYAAAVFRFCRRVLKTREDAEDATMEIFMKLRDKLGQYDLERSFTAWLYRVSANHCWDSLRRRRVRQDLETEDSDSLPLEHPDPGQLAQLMAQQSNAQMRTALAKLPERARMALVLRYYADMEYGEIAEALGVRRAFVGVVLLRARHNLRDVLQRADAAAEPKPLGTARDAHLGKGAS
jgi:RNA polymerase sigma-70 factor (ECF subfamily)